MALKHGNKNYYQVLIDPHRSKLIEKAAEKKGMKGTAWVRKARTGDLSRAITFLKDAREIHEGKIAKRKQARKNYVKTQMDKADLPVWW